MPSLTPNSSLYTWLENDYVDVSQINANFETIDEKMCSAEGVTSARVCINGVSGTTSTINWWYRKYPTTSGNDTVTVVEMSANYSPSNVRCNQIDDTGLFFSGTISVEFPFDLDSVHNLQIHCAAANTKCWAADTSNQTIPMDLRISGISPFDGTTTAAYGFKFIVIGTEHENTLVDRYKQIFITVRGVLDE